MTAFWDIAPCSLVEVDRRFRGAYCLHYQGDETLGFFDSKGLESPNATWSSFPIEVY
jgi:hypothetical protein